MANDDGGDWTAGEEARDGGHLLTSTLAEPAVFYDADTLAPAATERTPALPEPSSPASATTSAPPGDLYASLGHGSADEPTRETLAELATMGVPTTPLRDHFSTPGEAVNEEVDERLYHEAGLSAPAGETEAADLWASLSDTPEPAPAASGVHALRSLLLGGGPDYDARLTLTEHRLEQLALYVTSEVGAMRSDGASVPELERRVDALAERVEQALDLARGGDVSLSALSTLQRQVAELRLEQAKLSDTIGARMRALDERTRLRQRQARTARRVEVQRLRMRVYAPPETLGSSRLRAIEQRAARRAAASGAGDLTSPALHAVRHGHDAGAAWHAFSRGIAVFFGALLTLIVVLARVTGEHLRDAWEDLMALFGRE